MNHAIDLTRFHFMRELGDIVVFGTWVFNGDQENTEPCLVILPRYRRPSSVRPCVVALSAAYLYDDPRYCVRAAMVFAKNLGFADSMTTTNKIATILHDQLPELLKMPLDPKVGVVTGEAVVNFGDGRKKTVEFVDYDQLKQL